VNVICIDEYIQYRCSPRGRRNKLNLLFEANLFTQKRRVGRMKKKGGGVDLFCVLCAGGRGRCGRIQCYNFVHCLSFLEK